MEECYSLALRQLARTYMDMGDLPRAREALQSARPQMRRNFRLCLGWAMLRALEGQEPEALHEMDPGVQRYAEVHVLSTAEAAALYAALGHTEKALEWLDRAVRHGDERAAYFRRDPLLTL